MKNYIKMGVALVIMIGAVLWAVSSVRSQSYSGTDLNFVVGSGPVTVNNTSDAAVTAQLVSPGTRTFSVTSSIDGAAGTSAKQGTGSATTQLFEIVLPTGTSVFTVTRGSGVSVTALSDARLTATIQPLPESETRTTGIIAGVVVLAALYYLSRTTGHRWLPFLRNRMAANRTPVVPVIVTAAAGQGSELRAYGDNRADTKPL